METRLDRIEKALETLLVGIAERMRSLIGSASSLRTRGWSRGKWRKPGNKLLGSLSY